VTVTDNMGLKLKAACIIRPEGITVRTKTIKFLKSECFLVDDMHWAMLYAGLAHC